MSDIGAHVPVLCNKQRERLSMPKTRKKRFLYCLTTIRDARKDGTTVLGGTHYHHDQLLAVIEANDAEHAARALHVSVRSWFDRSSVGCPTIYYISDYYAGKKRPLNDKKDYFFFSLKEEEQGDDQKHLELAERKRFRIKAPGTSRNGILIVSGPSGAGKTTLVQKLLKENPGFVRSKSTTTRKPRDGEIGGNDYDFVSEEQFDIMVQRGDFVEHAIVHGKRYGTPYDAVTQAVKAGKTVVLTIDVQGRARVQDSTDPRFAGVKITSVFVDVDIAEVGRRLEKRGDTSREDIKTRVEEAEKEIARCKEFNFRIKNPTNQIETGYQNLKRVLRLE